MLWNISNAIKKIANTASIGIVTFAFIYNHVHMVGCVAISSNIWSDKVLTSGAVHIFVILLWSKVLWVAQ